MFLAKDANGYWYVYFHGADGKRKRTSTRCHLKSDALKFLQSFKTERVAKPKSVLLSNFIAEFTAYAKSNYSKGTVEIYEAALKNLIAITSDLSLPSLTPQHWDTYRITRLKTISPVTANLELRTLRAALNTAMRWKLIASNPFSRQPMCVVQERVPIFFTKEEFKILIGKITERWLKEIVIFATCTGLRRGEISNLKWASVNLRAKAIVIESDATFKTKHGRRRTIPLNDTALHLLQQKTAQQPDAYVFLLNGKKIEGDWIGHKFKYYVYECKLRNDRLHFHSLRHTFASWLVQDGVSIYAVKELLGHSSVKTTEVYSHLTGSALHGEVNKISIVLS